MTYANNKLPLSYKPKFRYFLPHILHLRFISLQNYRDKEPLQTKNIP
ncbi:hypothetical protein HMPREF6745_1740 [Prevotella sp. oral taxon 472 str. F0295]|nr:hypothetical protein HMPREF6745_1740 [Prevotella sp. oral taxon 472 str. F0295]